MTIKYYTKHVYGQELIYLTGAAADAWQHLAGKKTISESEMGSLTELTGVTFERTFAPSDVNPGRVKEYR